MLKIEHQSSTQLILQDRRTYLRFLGFAFTVLSLFSIILLLVNSYQVLQIEGGLDLQRLPAQVIFIGVGFGFVGFGIFIILNMSRGITIIFDRETETVVIHSARFLRPHRQIIPIYGVSHLRVERNDELRVFGLFLVLRAAGRRFSGQIPLTSIPYYAQDHMEALVYQVQRFLNQ